MLNAIIISGGIVTAIVILFGCLFVRFGHGWNGDVGSGAVKRKR
jgi:hypothetical protein